MASAKSTPDISEAPLEKAPNEDSADNASRLMGADDTNSLFSRCSEREHCELPEVWMEDRDALRLARRFGFRCILPRDFNPSMEVIPSLLSPSCWLMEMNPELDALLTEWIELEREDRRPERARKPVLPFSVCSSLCDSTEKLE